jgi:hypothetical protein
MKVQREVEQDADMPDTSTESESLARCQSCMKNSFAPTSSILVLPPYAGTIRLE